jgi:hypothetical protein
LARLRDRQRRRQPDRDPIPGVWSIKRSAAALRDGLGSVLLWQETAPAAVRAASVANPDVYVSTQGHVLAVPDFLATLATEAAIHHLDMIVNLPDAPAPHTAALAIAAATLDGLAGSAALKPAAWTTEEYILKATGRLPLTADEREATRDYPLLS